MNGKITEGKFYFLLSTGIALVLFGLGILLPLVQIGNEPLTIKDIFDYIVGVFKYVLSIDIRIVIGTLFLALGIAIINFAGWAKIKK